MGAPIQVEQLSGFAGVRGISMAEAAIFEPTSQVPDATLRGLGQAPGSRVLVRGSRGDDVKQLQMLLGVAADGTFGAGTEAAVRAFQQRANLVVDGKVGQATWQALANTVGPPVAGAVVPGAQAPSKGQTALDLFGKAYELLDASQKAKVAKEQAKLAQAQAAVNAAQARGGVPSGLSPLAIGGLVVGGVLVLGLIAVMMRR